MGAAMPPCPTKEKYSNMPALFDNYCHVDLDATAEAAMSVYIADPGTPILPDSYSTDTLAGSITLLDTIAPTGSLTLYPPSCSTIGYRPWIVGDFADVSALWGAAALVIVAAWGFKMAKRAIS